MAHNSYEIQSSQALPKSLCSSNNSNSDDVLPCRFVKINFANDGSVTSGTSKRGKLKKNTELKSPYLNGEKIRLLSRITEKSIVQKKATDFVSSFPLAANIYKANSDEFKSIKRANKKVKKSVLTLPNEPILTPQTCTVSDMNDSEYLNQEDGKCKSRPKKRIPIQNNRRSRRKRDFEFYDRDAQYCSQMNINLDCSSTDIITNFNGDSLCNRRTNKSYKKQKPQTDENCYGQDVWAVLRNINRFQFKPSPPMSEESIVTMKKKKVFQRRPNRRDTRFVGTCRTEEFAYISSIEVDSKTPTSFSQTSSFDRITVIDNEDEFNKVCKEFGENMAKTCNLVKDANAFKNHRQIKNKTQRQSSPRNYTVIEPRTNVKIMSRQFDTKKGRAMREIKLKECDNGSVYKDSLNLNVGQDKAFDQQKFTAKYIHEDLKAIDSQNLNNKKINSRINRLDDFNDVFNNSRNSNPIKVGLDSTVIVNQDNHKITNAITDESKQLKGITKVVLSTGHEAHDTVQYSKRLELKMRKPRLFTTMPSTIIMPKPTQTDIKRRLANMKFPLVILGKDQLSSTFEVMDYNAPQFDGLDESIWPFMLDWYGENRPKTGDHVMQLNRKFTESNIKRIKNSTIPAQSNMNGLRKSDYNICTSKRVEKREKNTLRTDSINKNKSEQNNTTICSEMVNKHQKQKPIRLLKDKMLKFLYKKSPVPSATEEIHNITGHADVQKCKSPFNTGVKGDVIISGNHNAILTQNSIEVTKRRYWSPQNSPNTRSSTEKHPWSKAKWPSDFIDNVIKKIKNGVYYNQYKHSLQSQHFYETKSPIDFKEASIQTALATKNTSNTAVSDICMDVTSIQKNDALQAILGFDNSLPQLEIKTLTKHQIEVKHCVANVMVQFDVAIPTETDKVVMNIKNTISLLSMDATESDTKVFKCKTIILNAMLPAELCSILPKMLGKITESDSILTTSLLPISKTESHLSTISELSHFENHEPLKMLPQLQHDMSPEIRWLLKGMFMPLMVLEKNLITNMRTVRNNVTHLSIVELLPKLPENLIKTFKINPIELKIFKTTTVTPEQRPIKKHQIDFKTCTALQPYNAAARQLIPSLERLNFTGMFENMWNYYKMNANVCPSTNFLEMKLETNFNVRSLTMSLKVDCGEEKNMVIAINKLNIDSLFEGCTKNNNEKVINFLKYSSQQCIPCIESSCVNKLQNKDSRNHVSVNITKPKRKCFVKLYRKCKSTTNLSQKKSCTALSKITTLDDFFQLLGSDKSLSSVFDGQCAEKLLSSILEMKNWITEINSRQALLVLLLINKKDTPNLVRFRPILLQGIAVNRITRATELDMEIEVIEREHFYKLSQYDGIPYMRESNENQGNLLEELYWIAKTTASDYQRPFDVSSEKLLKSLLEKRKKLNPSYLRVMARYVGLGLLKLPRKD